MSEYQEVGLLEGRIRGFLPRGINVAEEGKREQALLETISFKPPCYTDSARFDLSYKPNFLKLYCVDKALREIVSQSNSGTQSTKILIGVSGAGLGSIYAQGPQ